MAVQQHHSEQKVAETKCKTSGSWINNCINRYHSTQGSMQNTGRPLDLAISGNGYFQVTDGTNTYYSRAGNFYLDVEGNIVNSEGLKLKGDADLIIPQEAQSFSIGADGKVTYVGDTGEPVDVGVIELAIFANPEGLTKEGSNLFQQSRNSGEPQSGVPGDPATGATGTLQSGFLEMSNVDLTEEFTEMIIANAHSKQTLVQLQLPMKFYKKLLT